MYSQPRTIGYSSDPRQGRQQILDQARPQTAVVPHYLGVSATQPSARAAQGSTYSTFGLSSLTLNPTLAATTASTHAASNPQHQAPVRGTIRTATDPATQVQCRVQYDPPAEITDVALFRAGIPAHMKIFETGGETETFDPSK